MDVPAIQKLNYSHDGMIDLIISNPSITQDQIAASFGYSPAWVSRIITSDAFQSRLAARRHELVDPEIRERIELGFKAIVARSTEILLEKLSMPASAVPHDLALRALEIASRASGYGARGTEIKVEVDVSTHFDRLRGNLTRMLTQRPDDQEPIDVDPD